MRSPINQSHSGGVAGARFSINRLDETNERKL